jgi:hypothetical protein
LSLYLLSAFIRVLFCFHKRKARGLSASRFFIR